MQCKRCQLEKSEDEFPKRKLRYGYGRRTSCLVCYREDGSRRSRVFYKKHEQQQKVQSKLYYRENKEHILKRNYIYVRQKRRIDLNFKLAANIRARLNCALKNNQKVGSSVANLGCSIEELKIYLETQFQPGMTWENWSQTGWHIDHKIPLSKLNLSNPVDFARAVHFSNLQPLWASANLEKSNKYGT